MKKVIIQTIIFLNTILFYSVFILYASVKSYFLQTSLVICFLNCSVIYYFRT